jgi:hypothetical protein
MTNDGTTGGASPEELLALAASKIGSRHPALAGAQREAAVRLLADLYETALRHGITPQHWAAVAGLPIESVDAVRYRDRLAATRTQLEQDTRDDVHRPPSRVRSHGGRGR